MTLHRSALWAWCLSATAAIFGNVAAAQPAPAFDLPTAGCPMAHCDARMSDLVATRGPARGRRVAVDRRSAAARGGLGCVSNLRLAACTGAGDAPDQARLSVYDADGGLIWDDAGQLLGPTAWLSAPIISTTGEVVAADQERIVRVDPLSGSVRWNSPKPDSGSPISPVLLGAQKDMILLATKASLAGGVPELSVWDLRTGALLDHRPIVDPTTGAIYATANTPAVQDGRAYLLTSRVDDGEDGRLVAVDVCESAACGGRGVLRVAWFHAFDGPSNSSPVFIDGRLFFDGLRGIGFGVMHAVDDLGTAAQPIWSREFEGRFGASAAHDPRGGLWVWPFGSGQMLRLDQADGAVLQEIDVSSVAGLQAGYAVVTATSVSSSRFGGVVLSFGAQHSSGTGPTYVIAIDASRSAQGKLAWRYKVAADPGTNAATGQFPVLINQAGARRVVFRGTRSGTFFVGEP